MADRVLELQLIANDRMTKTFQKAERSLMSFGKRADVVGKKMAAMGKTMSLKLTAPIIGLGVAVLKTAADFEFGMNKVGALTGATTEELEKMEKQAKELGRTTMFSARQVSDAMGFMAMAGFETNDILAATPKLLELAAAGNIDLARAADITTNILTGYGLEVEQLGAANDVLAKTFTSTNTDLNQLGEAFKFVGPLAAGMEIPFQDTAAAIGLLGNAGIQASMAGTTLRGALARITQAVTPTGEALNSTGAAITKLGLNFFTSEGKVKTFTEIVKELETKGVSTAKIMEIFGLRAGPGLAALVGQGSKAMEELVEKLNESGGTAKEIADKQMEGLRGQMLKLKSAFEGLAIAIADSGLLEFATNLAQKLTDLATRLAESNPRLLKWGTIVLGVVAALGPMLIALGFAVQGMAGLATVTTFASGILLTKMIPALLSTAIKLRLVTVSATTAKLAISGLGKALLLVGAFAAGWKIGTILTEKFEVVRKFGIALVGGMLKIWEFIKIGAESIWIVIRRVFTEGFNFLLVKIQDKVKSLANVIQSVFELTGIDALGAAANKLNDVYISINDSMKQTVPLIDEIGKAAEDNFRRIAEIEEIAGELWNEVPVQAKEVGIETGIEMVSGIQEGVQEELPRAEQTVDDAAIDLGTEFQDEFAGVDLGAGMMDDIGAGILESGPTLASAAQSVIAPMQSAFDTFADSVNEKLSSFGAGLKATEITVPTKQLNAAIAKITGGQFAGVGGPAPSAGALNTSIAAQFAAMQGPTSGGVGGLTGLTGALPSGTGSLFGFARGGVATKPTPGVFGEAGPEALIPLDKFGGLGKTIVNNIIFNNATMLGNDTDARLFAKRIIDFIDEENARR